MIAWANCPRDKYGVIPVFAHVNKDMAEIGMLQTSWALKIQLCWWHMRKAVHEWLSKGKLATTPYNVQQVQAEFDWISTTFVPLTKPSIRVGSWKKTSRLRNYQHPTQTRSSFVLQSQSPCEHPLQQHLHPCPQHLCDGPPILQLTNQKLHQPTCILDPCHPARRTRNLK